MIAAPPQPEFSRRIACDEVGSGVLHRRLEATESERAALATRFGLLGLPRLEAEVKVEREGNGYNVGIDLDADVLQSCVVSLEPVAARIMEHVTVRFATEVPDEDPYDVTVDVEADDPPEAIVAGRMEVGEVIAQYLCLALNPYPKRADAELEAAPAQAPEAGPFAALEKLKR